MNVSVYLLDAALSGDDLALKQLNDILEEHKLEKIPELKLHWDKKFKTSSILKNFYYVVCTSHRDQKLWRLYLDGVFLGDFNSQEEGKKFAESETRKKIYGRP
jgi:hypothetical protein